MASSISNASKQPVVDDDVVEEPSMEEILASIKQIIAEDEMPDDGLSERERYTHPTDHSNSNTVDDEITADLEAAMEVELEASVAETSVVASPEKTITNSEPAVKGPTTLEDRVSQVRREVSAAGAGLSSDQRLEQYRVRGKLKMEALAAQKAKEAAQPAPVPVAPVISATPVLPTTNAIAQEMAATMMKEKSSEIESLLSELMRPTIRQWLSDNLPSMVEKLVREEIERVSRGKTTS